MLARCSMLVRRCSLEAMSRNVLSAAADCWCCCCCWLHGSGAGLTALERAEAELDRRERAFGLLLASVDSGAIGSKSTKYIRTYSDIAKCNTCIDPLYDAGAIHAAKDQATAGV